MAKKPYTTPTLTGPFALADVLRQARLEEAEQALTHRFGACADGRDPMMCKLCGRIAFLRSAIPPAPAAEAEK